MRVNLKLLSKVQLNSHDLTKISGRILSINIGKKMCVGVIHLSFGYCMFNYPIADYHSNMIGRGDIVVFDGVCKCCDNKAFLLIEKLYKIVKCNGVLPNKQFKGEKDNNRLVPVMFTPDYFQIIKLSSVIQREIRKKLYIMEFDEIHTPTLYNYKSPSNAPCFKVKSVNGNTLYLKTTQR